MVQIKRIEQDKITAIVANTGFNYELLTKDYFVTVVLYLLKDVKDIYFKGGIALNKIFLNHARLSEDADYTVTANVHKIKEEIIHILEACDLFTQVTIDKRVDKFVRIIAHYKNFAGILETVFVDLNQKASLLLEPEQHEIKHYYDEDIPIFSVKTLAKKEMLAEKMAATIGRNKPRDHFDMYQIVKRGLPLDFKLVKEKCVLSNCEFDIIKMFNKAKRLKNRWDEDIEALLVDKISFQTVMTTLAKHFKLKEQKAKKK